MSKKRVDFISRAKEAEKKAKQLHREEKEFLKENYGRNSREGYTDETARKLNEMKIPLAKAYEYTAKNWMVAKKIKKAERYYLLATREYGDLYQSRYTDPAMRGKFQDRCFNGIKVLERLKKVRSGKWHGLEGRASATTAIIGFVIGLSFFSSNITGNVIGNLNNSTSNYIGIVFILVGLIGSSLWMRKRDK